MLKFQSSTFLRLYFFALNFSVSEQFARKADAVRLCSSHKQKCKHAACNWSADRSHDFVAILWRSFFKRSRLLKHEQTYRRAGERERAPQERGLRAQALERSCGTVLNRITWAIWDFLRRPKTACNSKKSPKTVDVLLGEREWEE